LETILSVSAPDLEVFGNPGIVYVPLLYVRIRILPSTSKKIRRNLDFYSLVTAD
jgi:hypothetical protein